MGKVRVDPYDYLILSCRNLQFCVNEIMVKQHTSVSIWTGCRGFDPQCAICQMYLFSCRNYKPKLVGSVKQTSSRGDLHSRAI